MENVDRGGSSAQVTGEVTMHGLDGVDAIENIKLVIFRAKEKGEVLVPVDGVAATTEWNLVMGEEIGRIWVAQDGRTISPVASFGLSGPVHFSSTIRSSV